ncbi:MAG: DNA-processing protein DprA [Planctomycetota bacterium]
MECPSKEQATLASAVRLGLTPAFGTRRFRQYLDAGGDLAEAGRGDAKVLRTRLRMDPPTARRLARALRQNDPQRELSAAARAGIVVSPWGGPGYPGAFRELADPPPVVYRRGAFEDDEGEVRVAVMGTRRATTYGERIARTLGADLARAGVSVLAGFGRGIDTAAHEGALSAGGRCVGVLASGLLEPYPPEGLEMLERVAQTGAVFSEFPLRVGARPEHFPKRNRLLAALSLAVVVVEAGERSGVMSLVRHALDLGREVLAVPGPVDRESSRGTLRLLREGATPIGSSRDLFEALGWCRGGPADLPKEERAVLEALAPGPAASAKVAVECSLTEECAAGLLLTLEVRGLVARQPDGHYELR